MWKWEGEWKNREGRRRELRGDEWTTSTYDYRVVVVVAAEAIGLGIVRADVSFLSLSLFLSFSLSISLFPPTLACPTDAVGSCEHLRSYDQPRKKYIDAWKRESMKHGARERGSEGEREWTVNGARRRGYESESKIGKLHQVGAYRALYRSGRSGTELTEAGSRPGSLAVYIHLATPGIINREM